MPDPKRVALLNRLLEKTYQGKVLWEPSIDEGAFQANFSGYSVRLFPRGAQYILQIYNEEGSLIEEFNDEELIGGIFPVTGGAFSTMGQIYAMARRVVLGVDKALDTLLSELDQE